MAVEEAGRSGRVPSRKAATIWNSQSSLSSPLLLQLVLLLLELFPLCNVKEDEKGMPEKDQDVYNVYESLSMLRTVYATLCVRAMGWVGGAFAVGQESA